MYLRSFLYVLIFGVLILNSCARHPKGDLETDRDQWNLKGNVKSLSETNYSLNGVYRTNVEFNKDGFVKNQESFNPDKSLIRRWKYQYDGQNHKLSRVCIVKNDSLSYTMYYYYNSKWKVLSTKSFKSNGTLGSQYICQYDKKFNLVKEISLGEKDTIESQVSRNYNKKGQIVVETFENNVFHKVWRQIYRYNNKGLTEEIDYLTPQNMLLKVSKYTYYANRKLEKFQIYDAVHILVASTTYKYDKYDNLLETSELIAGSQTPNIKTFQYKYDKKGNWIFGLQSSNGAQGSIMVRKIEYY